MRDEGSRTFLNIKFVGIIKKEKQTKQNKEQKKNIGYSALSVCHPSCSTAGADRLQQQWGIRATNVVHISLLKW